MKRKDIITLVITVVILLVAGYLAYTQLFASKSKSSKGNGTEVEVVGSIPSSLDQSGLDTLGDSSKTEDFVPTVDLSSGLGTTTPFGK